MAEEQHLCLYTNGDEVYNRTVKQYTVYSQEHLAWLKSFFISIKLANEWSLQGAALVIPTIRGGSSEDLHFQAVFVTSEVIWLTT